MKTKLILFLIIILSPAMLFPGEISCTISKKGKPYAKQVVTITNKKGVTIKTATTDDFGTFTITISTVGPLLLKTGEGAVAEIYSSKTRVSYTFKLDQKDSKWQLNQK